ncbi:lipoate--protein ligase family protein [bacterium]|nr:lipoate--protein ligase family protein [bacterium]
MAVDEALLQNFKKDDLPIFRLYRWEPSISLGRFSNICESVDLHNLHKQNLSYVRRMTGGGILIHGGDLSYSLILPRESLKNVGVKESYRYLCRFLIEFYKKLGLNANFASELNLNSSKSNICMAAHEPYDIIIDGKKMGANAQRYTSKTLFQHGSIPMSINNEVFKDVFLEESGLKHAAALDKTGQKTADKEFVLLLREAFVQSFEANLIDDSMQKSEQSSADALLMHKYSQERWNINAKHNEI